MKYWTSEFKPDPNTLVLAWITTNKDSALVDPILNGNNLTWEKVRSIDWGSGGNRTTLFKAMGTDPQSTQLSIEFGGPKQRGCSWSILQFNRVATWGTNGSAAVVQSASASGSGSNGEIFTITLGGLADEAANATAGGFAFGTTSTPSPTPVTGDGYSSAPVIQHGAPTTTILSEWRVPGSTAVRVTQGAVSDFGGIAVEIGACSTTTLGNGSDPQSVTRLPGAAATDVDSFTFQTLRGTNLVTDVTLALQTGSYSGIELIEIVNDAGFVYGSLSNPTTDSPKITLTTSITASTTESSYKIRVTPKSHANMPVPPGTAYGIKARISDWTDTNDHAGEDPGSATLSIDNLSPGDVTGVTASPGDTEATISWTNPAASDLDSVVVLRSTTSSTSDRPAEGVTYTAGTSVGTSSKVGCIGTKPSTSCVDSGLTNHTTYYYKAFGKDTTGNYSATGNGGVQPAAATPEHYQPDAMVRLDTETDASYLTDNTYEATASAQVKSQGVKSGSTAIYRLRFQNDGTTMDNLVITGTRSDANFTVQYLDETQADRTSEVTTGGGAFIDGVAVGATRVWTLNVTPNGGTSAVSGGTSCDVVVSATSGTNGAMLDRVKTTTTSTSAKITLIKSADKSTYIPGEDITYITTATNGAGLTAASGIEITDPIPANTGFKIGGAQFDPGTTALTGGIKYFEGAVETTPHSGGCGAPSGYDYCITQIRWIMTGSMETGKSFTLSLVVGVK